MKMLTEYLERALEFEQLAASEQNGAFKEQLLNRRETGQGIRPALTESTSEEIRAASVIRRRARNVPSRWRLYQEFPLDLVALCASPQHADVADFSNCWPPTPASEAVRRSPRGLAPRRPRAYRADAEQRRRLGGHRGAPA
jgi:hypothetical protein